MIIIIVTLMTILIIIIIIIVIIITVVCQMLVRGTVRLEAASAHRRGEGPRQGSLSFLPRRISLFGNGRTVLYSI